MLIFFGLLARVVSSVAAGLVPSDVAPIFWILSAIGGLMAGWGFGNLLWGD